MLEGSSIRVSWDAVEGADYFKVYHYETPHDISPECRLSRIGTVVICNELAVDVRQVTYLHARPDLDHHNFYWVVACNRGGCSDIDEENPAVVEAGSGRPDSPANQRYEYDGSAVVLSWDASSGADSYTVYYDAFFDSNCRLSSGSPSFCEELATNLSSTSYTHADPDPDEHYYWVVACNSVGCSEIDSANPAALGGTPPGAPANQRYGYDGAAIVLSWDASAGADSYTVYHDDFSDSSCRLSFGSPSFCEELATDLTVTTFTHADPDRDENYYWVVACNRFGCSTIDSANPGRVAP